MPISLIRRFSLQLAKNFAEIYILGYALYNPHITIQTGSPMAKLYSKYAVNIKQKMHQNVTKLFNKKKIQQTHVQEPKGYSDVK